MATQVPFTTSKFYNLKNLKYRLKTLVQYKGFNYLACKTGNLGKSLLSEEF